MLAAGREPAAQSECGARGRDGHGEGRTMVERGKPATDLLDARHAQQGLVADHRAVLQRMLGLEDVARLARFRRDQADGSGARLAGRAAQRPLDRSRNLLGPERLGQGTEHGKAMTLRQGTGRLGLAPVAVAHDDNGRRDPPGREAIDDGRALSRLFGQAQHHEIEVKSCGQQEPVVAPDSDVTQKVQEVAQLDGCQPVAFNQQDFQSAVQLSSLAASMANRRRSCA